MIGMSPRRVIAIAEIDEAELAVRVAETFLRLKRPPGRDLHHVLEQMKDMDPAFLDDCSRVARTAMEYFQERVAAIQRVQ